MASLEQVYEAKGETLQHVIFIHGLDGNQTDTWQSSSFPSELWPRWLGLDLNGVSIWTVGYKAEKTRWFSGNGLHVIDRGSNVFELLIAESRLQAGEIIFVGHSLGGLVIKQILRVAENQAHLRADASNFIKRVRRVAFLGTPHFGSSLSSLSVLFRAMVRPSLVTYSLVKNDANLRGLNDWYKTWSYAHQVDHLILMESDLSKLLGPFKAKIVEPDSADPGLLTNAIMVGANHYNICKPESRKSEIYIHIRNLISKKLSTSHRDTLIEKKLDHGTKKLEMLEDAAKEGFSTLNEELISQPEKTAELVTAGVLEVLEKSESDRAFSHELFDIEINKILSAIRKSRFFGGYPTLDKVDTLVARIIHGNLSDGTSSVKSQALAWCSRLQAFHNTDKAIEYLDIARKLGESEEVEVAEAFILAKTGQLSSAIEKLMSSPSAAKYSACFFIIKLNESVENALQWKDESHLELSDFDADGKIAVINALFSTEQWVLALKNAESISVGEYRNSPALLNQVAMAHLVMVVPPELRNVVLYQVPFASKGFPLFSNEASLVLRNKTIELFSECSLLAREIGLDDAANLVDDYILWLELRDPKRTTSAMLKLENSMSGDPECILRRFSMGLQFGVNVDLVAIENEVDRQTAITRGKSVVAGLARFALVQTKRTPKEMVQYIDANRQQLTSFIHKDSLYLLEIEALIKSGLVNDAESRLSAIGSGEITASARESLKNMIAAASGADALALSIAQFEKTSSITDLAYLVKQLEEKHRYKQLIEFAEELFQRTKSIEDAERLVNTKVRLKLFKSAGDFLVEHIDLVKQSDFLRTHWAWALYRAGRLSECRKELSGIGENIDHSNTRALKVNLAITSGDWEALLPYIESEWQNREQRTAGELLQASQLAKVLQPKRAKDLIFAATRAGADNPEILASAYFAASSMGWENEDVVAGWLHDAAQLSGEEGPLHSMSLKDFSESMPVHQEKNSNIWKMLNDGSAPVFIAAKYLNRTLTDFYLLPALSNPTETDVRWRSFVPAFSNVRLPYHMECDTISIDATALLTLGYLELLGMVIERFDNIFIPHSTLSWLFVEKQKIAFHQPSKIEQAKQIGRMLADKKINVLQNQQIVNTDLAMEIGDELALLFQEARNNVEGYQSLVVRSFPVHKIGSFMNEIVDLSDYSDNLCSCSALVKKLRDSGKLTSDESQIALDYLSTHESDWPNEIDISDEAIIYLDGLSVTYLQYTGVLEKLVSSGFKIFVHQEESDRLKAMRDFEVISLQADKILEDIRSYLTDGIKSGVIVVCATPDQIDDDIDDSHPTLEIFAASEQSDASVIDDRFLNQHKNIAFKSGESPVHTTLDLLDDLCLKGIISMAQKMSYRNKLRQAGYIFISFLPGELDYHLSHAKVVGGKIQETAELRVIRECISQLKMSRSIQLPRDANWVSEDLKYLSHCLKNQWLQGLDESVCIARSEWLLQIIDFRGWAHCFDGSAGYEMARYGAGIHISTLFLAPEGMAVDVKERYWKWFDERIIESLKHDDPASFRWLIKSAKAHISNNSERALKEADGSL